MTKHVDRPKDSGPRYPYDGIVRAQEVGPTVTEENCIYYELVKSSIYSAYDESRTRRTPIDASRLWKSSWAIFDSPDMRRMWSTGLLEQPANR